MLKEPYGEDEIANVKYQVGLLAAQRVTADSIGLFRRKLEELRAYHGDYPYYREWLSACAEGPNAVVALLTDRTEHGRYLRSVALLVPHFVTQEERDAYYRR